MQFRNGVFIITEKKNCPLYNAGEEMEVNEGTLKLPASKPTCLVLAKDIIELASEDVAFESMQQGASKKNKFECGGCTGIIRFEFKKEKGYATLQMKLLAAADRKEKIKLVANYASTLRAISIFSSLSDDDVLDLSTLLEFEEFDWGFPIAQKGDPGTKLYIMITGRVEVIDDDGVVLAEMGTGDVFGEMSLLSGERVTTTIQAAEPCEIATMSQKNFRHILNKYPALQVFFYKLLVSRITTINVQRAEELASGMVGQISDISPVELCQMINSNQKTGHLKIESSSFKARLLFNEGEVIKADAGAKEGPDAFYDILALKEGRFKFIQGLNRTERKLSVIGGFMGMLMEGMKRLDDRRQ
jgi:CRP/FNR family transcriptional regulator, cyclic AMP receptor protein